MARQPGTRNEPVQPTITYMQACLLRINNVEVCKMTAGSFADWLEATISSSDQADDIRKRLQGHDYQFMVDRWAALLILREKHVEISQKTAQNEAIIA